MVTYIIRRLFAAVILLLIITMITFVIFYEVPLWGGQTAESLAASYVGKQQNPQAIQAVIHRMGFDQPLLVHYWHYVSAIVAGTDYSTGTQIVHCSAPCFGYSFKNYQQVWPTILSDFPITLSIAIGAGVLWLGFGVLTGVISAVRKGSIWDRMSMGVSLLGVALPVYFILPLMTLVLEYHWNIFTVQYTSFWTNPISWAGGLLLPWVALAFGYAALYTRLTRAGMLEALNEDFVRTARAKGLSERTVIFKHALRAAITPIVTIFGMDLGSVLGGAVLVEVSAGLLGIGGLAIQAIQNQDYPVMMGITLFAAAFIVLANLVVDIVYSFIDPRVKVA